MFGEESHRTASQMTRHVCMTMLAGASLLAGCSRPAGPARYDVRGTVKFQGAPVPSGAITLEPDPARSNVGPVSVIPIIDGSFDSRALKRPGPLAGPLVIRIKGYPAYDPASEGLPPLFPEYRTTIDLAPSGSVTELAFEVPEQRHGGAGPR